MLLISLIFNINIVIKINRNPFSKTELFEKIEAGDFPKPVDIDRVNKWLESEIHQWLSSKNLHISR